MAIFGPLLLPAADRTNPIRLLLLPIAATTLYVAQSAAALGDIWVLLMLPLVVCIPVGMAAGGAVSGALIAAVAGALLVVTVLAISSAATSLLHLAVRDRRRGEVLGLLFLLVLPIVGMLPSLAASRRQGPGSDPTVGARRVMPSPRVIGAARPAFSVYPTELYVGATRGAAELDLGGASRAIGGLAVHCPADDTAGRRHVFGEGAGVSRCDDGRGVVCRRAGRGRITVPGLSRGASARRLGTAAAGAAHACAVAPSFSRRWCSCSCYSSSTGRTPQGSLCRPG